MVADVRYNALGVLGCALVVVSVACGGGYEPPSGTPPARDFRSGALSTLSGLLPKHAAIDTLKEEVVQLCERKRFYPIGLATSLAGYQGFDANDMGEYWEIYFGVSAQAKQLLPSIKLSGSNVPRGPVRVYPSGKVTGEWIEALRKLCNDSAPVPAYEP